MFDFELYFVDPPLYRDREFLTGITKVRNERTIFKAGNANNFISLQTSFGPMDPI